MIIAYFLKNISERGGIERVVTSKSNYLANHGFEVHIVSSSQSDSDIFFELDSKVRTHDLKIKKNKSKENLSRFLTSAEDWLKENKPHIAISTGDKYSIEIWRIRDGSQKVLELHFAKYKKAQFMYLLERWSLGRAISNLYRRKMYVYASRFSKFVVLTEEDRENWGEIPGICVIPNATTLNTQHPSDVENTRVIALGRYTKQKNFESLLRIWKKIKESDSLSNNQWVLEIFGDGDSAYLIKIVNELNIQYSVKINSITNNIEEELKNSSVLALTSRYEGFGMVLIEAMSCGVPVVSYACKSGPRDIIREGHDGFLIRPGDEQDFANKIALLIADESLRKRMGKNAFDGSNRFNEDHIMQRWITLFKEVSASHDAH